MKSMVSGWSVGLTLLAGALAWNFRTVEVQGPSMMPTFQNGQRLTMVRFGLGEPQVGDVVVARVQGETVIKRVYATENQVVRGQTYGLPFDSVVPAGEVFLVGDNPSQSVDSRSFGPVPKSAILGKIWQANPTPVSLPKTLDYVGTSY